MAWETRDTTSDRQEMDDMTADTTVPVAPSGGTQSLAGSPTYDAYANTQMGRLSRIVALHAGVSEPSTSQMLAERLAESARKALEAETVQEVRALGAALKSASSPTAGDAA